MLKSKDIILRDFKESDIEKRIYWETEETEWQLWDGPWEFEGLVGAEKRAHLQRYVKRLRERATKRIPEHEKRISFQIDTCGEDPRYIGWMASYYLTERFGLTRSITTRCAVGIDIPDRSARGRGYAYQALSLFIDYLLEHGETEIYIQTWSGNERMVHIAEKMGFEECDRKKNFRTVRGRTYDGLTFRLNEQKYAVFKETYAL